MIFRTRRELEAQLFASRAARRRAASHRDPSWFELMVGLTAFVGLSATGLYVAAWLGR